MADDPNQDVPEPNLDVPGPYIEALDYIAPLEKLGYQVVGKTYRKELRPPWPTRNSAHGILRITVRPHDPTFVAFNKTVYAIIAIDYLSEGEVVRIQDICIFSMFDIVDTVSEIERMVNANRLSLFVDELRKRDFPGGGGIPSRGNLWDTFHESQGTGDNEEKFDLTRYVQTTPDYNPVALLTSKDVRNIIRGVGYRVTSIYKRSGLGWSVSMVPVSDERSAALRDNPRSEQDYLIYSLREGIIKRLPRLAGTKGGASVFDSHINLRVWADAILSPAATRVDVSIWPSDWEKRGRGGVVRHDESLPVPGPEPEFNPDDPQTFLRHARSAKMGDLVTVVCPMCGDKRQLFKNWPDSSHTPSLGSTCGKCGGLIELGSALAEAIEDPDAEMDKEAYTKDTLVPDDMLKSLGYQFVETQIEEPYLPTTAHWFKQVTSDIQFVVCVNTDYRWQFQVYLNRGGLWNNKLSSPDRKQRWLKADLIRWEKKAQDGLKFYESEESGNVDDPAAMLSHWKNKYYMAFGRKSDEDRETVFGRFGRLSDAFAKVKKDYLCSDYEEIRIVEYADSRHFPDMYSSTGVRYTVTPDGQLKDVSKPRPGSVKEADENVDDLDAQGYVDSTLFPLKFLSSLGWDEEMSEGDFQYYAKVFPLPRVYKMLDHTYSGIRVRIGYDPKFKHYIVFVCFGELSNSDFDIKSQYVWPLADKHEHENVRKFVQGIDQVLAGIAWPSKINSAFKAASLVQTAVKEFMRELHAAKPPIRREGIVGETFNPDDAASFVSRMRTKPAEIRSKPIPSTPGWRTMRVNGNVIGWYREPDSSGKHGHLTKWQVTLDPGADKEGGSGYHYCDSEAECLAWARMEAGTTTFDP